MNPDLITAKILWCANLCKQASQRLMTLSGADYDDEKAMREIAARLELAARVLPASTIEDLLAE